MIRKDKEVVDVRKVNFGSSVAETDEMLDDAFLETKSYKKVLESSCSMVIGRKGAGKSAMALGIEHRNLNFAVRVVPTNFDWDKLESFCIEAQEVATIPFKSLFKSVWMYLILLNVLQMVLRNKQIAEEDRRLLRKFSDERKKIDGDGIPNFLDCCYKVLEEMWRIEGPRKPYYYPSTQRMAFKEGIEVLKKVLLKSNMKWYILIDDLDKGLPEVDIKDQVVSYFMLSLIYAVHDLSPKKFCENLSVKCFVPSDIFYNLPIRHLDKMSPSIIPIEWNRNTLYELITKRIAISLNVKSKNHEYSRAHDYLWNRVFPETLPIRLLMPPYNKYNDINCFNYILSHTFFRPRDILHFCGKSCKEVAEEGNGWAGAPSLLRDNVFGALGKLCKDTVKHLFREYDFRYPKLRKIIDSFMRTQVKWSIPELWEHLEEVLSTMKWTITQKELARALYEVGFIGGMYMRKDTISPIRPATDVFFWYDRDDIDVNTADLVIIHPMFYNMLVIQQDYESR